MTDNIAAEAAKIRTSQNAMELLFTGKDPSLYGLAGAALILRGIMDYRRKWFLFGEKRLVPTRFGKQVRAHLENKDG